MKIYDIECIEHTNYPPNQKRNKTIFSKHKQMFLKSL